MIIQKLTGNLGAEIFDADITDAKQFDAIKAAFIEHSIIVIREQNISPQDHLTFARKWGSINVNRFFQPHLDYPEIALVIKEAGQTGAIGEEWHTDHAYDNAPALGSILHAIEVPPYGGDTVFCSMAAAFDALSDAMKEFLTGLYAWHSSRHVFGEAQSTSETSQTGRIRNAEKATQDARHPIIITHPLSGRKSLYVNPQFTTEIDGLQPNESAAILQMLYEHCKKPEFQCRVRWRKGDVTMWDNRATWHKAVNDYHGHRREMHRVTIEGCELASA